MTRKRIAVLYLAFVATVLVVTFVVLTRIGVSRTFVENLLAEVIVRDRFRIGDANLHLGDGILTLDSFELSTTQDEQGKPFVAVQRIELDVDTNPLGDVGRIRQARVDGLALDLDLSEGQAPDLSELFEQTGEIDGDGGPPPAVIVTNSRVTLRFAPDSAPVEFTDVNLQMLPEEAGSSRMVLTGSMTSPAGLPTEVSGQGDFASQEFRALLRIAEFPLDPGLTERFAPNVAEMLQEAELSGAARDLELWIEYSEEPEASTSSLVAGANVDITELSGTPPGVPYPLVGATARVTVSTRANGSLRFSLTDTDAAGDLSVKGMMTECFGEAPEFTIELNAEEMLIRQQLLDALGESPPIARILNAFEPVAGRVDASIQLRSDYDSDPPARIDLDLALSDVTLRWHGIPLKDKLREIPFPEPATRANGRVRLRGSDLYLDGLTFETCDAECRLDATIGTRIEDPYVIEFRSADAPFSDRVRAAIGSIAPEAVGFYDEYSPSGRSSAAITISGAGRAPSDVRIELRPLEASASWAGFPYRLDRLTGLIEIEPKGVFFELEGDHAATRVALNGRFVKPTVNPDEPETEREYRSELWVDARDIAIDNALARALDALGPEFDETWNLLGPGGHADCELSLWGDPDDEDVSYDLRIDARDADVQLEALAVPIRAIHGPIFVHGTGGASRIDIGVLHGRIDNEPGTEPAKIVLQGSARTGEDGTQLDIASTVTRLQVGETLRDALDANGAFDAESWDVFAPSGFVDVVSHQRLRPGAADLEHELRIRLDGVGSDAAMLPSPARNATGVVTVLDGVAAYRNLRFDIGDAEVYCATGRTWHEDRATRIETTVQCDAFPVDDKLANLFSGPMRQTYLDRDVEGWIHIGRLDLAFRIPDDDAVPFELDFKGRFDASDTSMSIGTRVHGLLGSFAIENGHLDASGGRVIGTVQGAGFTIAGHRVRGVQTELTADPSGITLRGLRARAHSGEIYSIAEGDAPDVTYAFAGDGTLRAELGFRAMSLSSALRANASASEYRGNLGGEIRLERLVGDDIQNAVGSGMLRITEGRLGEVPLFTAIYSHLAPNQRPRFDGVDLDFHLADQKLQIDRISARSPLLSVSGRGTLSMDGYLDMVLDFADLFSDASDWLVLPTIARALTTGVVQFQVYGYLRSPQAKPQWLWQSKPRRAPLGPIPSRRD